MYQTKYCAVATLLNATNEIVCRNIATGMSDLNFHPRTICNTIPTVLNILNSIENEERNLVRNINRHLNLFLQKPKIRHLTYYHLEHAADDEAVM
jgi:hypothetical protein